MLALGWPTTKVDSVARQSGVGSQGWRGRRTNRAQGLIDARPRVTTIKSTTSSALEKRRQRYGENLP